MPAIKMRASDFSVRRQRFRNLKRLGQGAFGSAYSGTLRPYGKVVVKTATGTSGIVSRHQAMDSLAHEVKVLARIQQFPFVPRLLEVGRDYFVMEDADGISMLKLLSGKGMEARTILSTIVSTAIIVHKLHESGIAHGDLEARNILLTPSGVVVIDFGLATLRGEMNPILEMNFKETMTKDIANILEDMLLVTESKTISPATKIAVLGIFEKYRQMTVTGKVDDDTGKKLAEDLLFVLSQEGASEKRGRAIKRDKVAVKVI